MKRIYFVLFLTMGDDSLSFSGGSVIKNQCANVGNSVSILGSERSSEEGNGNPVQYSYLGKPMDRGKPIGGLQSMGLKRVRQNLMTMTINKSDSDSLT